MRPRKRVAVPSGKDGELYRRLWRVVDGAVADALSHHPEYVTKGISPRVVRASVNKRVVGAIVALSKERGPAASNVG